MSLGVACIKTSILDPLQACIIDLQGCREPQQGSGKHSCVGLSAGEENF